jgi:hypothetical protein
MQGADSFPRPQEDRTVPIAVSASRRTDSNVFVGRISHEANDNLSLLFNG